MTEKKDDSLAFPCTELNSDGSPYATHLGMTLRDYFAGQALTGSIASWAVEDEKRFSHLSDQERAKLFAKWSYCVADAMLLARAKSEPTP